MTWIPCSMCNQFPCACWSWAPNAASAPQVQPFVFHPNNRLSDEDVERIADAVKKKLGERTTKRKR